MNRETSGKSSFLFRAPYPFARSMPTLPSLDPFSSDCLAPGKRAASRVQGKYGTADGCVILWSIVSTKRRQEAPPGESGAVALVKRRILIWRMRKFQGGLALLLRNSPRWHAKESVKGKRRAVTICKKRILDAVRLGRIAERPLCQCRRVQKKSENKKNLYPHLTNNGVSRNVLKISLEVSVRDIERLNASWRT